MVVCRIIITGIICFNYIFIVVDILCVVLQNPMMCILAGYIILYSLMYRVDSIIMVLKTPRKCFGFVVMTNKPIGYRFFFLDRRYAYCRYQTAKFDMRIFYHNIILYT